MTAVLEKEQKLETRTPRAGVRARFKSLFTRSQREAAKKMEPVHLYQGSGTAKATEK